MQHSNKIGIQGLYKVYNARNEVVFDWFSNIVVSSSGYGRNLIARQLGGDNSLPIEIDGMVLSTSGIAPTNADVTWGGSEVLVPIQLPVVSNNVITLSAFFTDTDLPNATYKKVGLAIDGRIFTSALLPSDLVKDSGEEFRIDAQITIN